MDIYLSPVLVFNLSFLAAVAVVEGGDGNQEFRKERNIPLLKNRGTDNEILITEILQRLDVQEARITTLEATVHQQQEQHANVVKEFRLEINKQANQQEYKDKSIRKLNIVRRQQKMLIDDLSDQIQYNVATEDKHKQVGKERNDNATNRIKETGLPQDIHEYQAETSVSKNEHRRLKQFTRGSLDVAFHAIMNTYVVEGLGEGQKIVFYTLLLNVGSSYHQHLGVFIAPTRGIYYFSVSLTSLYKDHRQFEASISKNGIQIVCVFGIGKEGKYDQGSSSATIELDQGDEVWVQFDYPTGGGIWGHKYSSFTGYLLFPN